MVLLSADVFASLRWAIVSVSSSAPRLAGWGRSFSRARPPGRGSGGAGLAPGARAHGARPSPWASEMSGAATKAREILGRAALLERLRHQPRGLVGGAPALRLGQAQQLPELVALQA